MVRRRIAPTGATEARAQGHDDAAIRRLAQAKFRYRASVEDIDFRLARGLDRSLVRSLTQNSAWVHQHQNVFLLGPCGVGKTWLACALAEFSSFSENSAACGGVAEESK